MLLFAKRALENGSRFGLYNHGRWTGEQTDDTTLLVMELQSLVDCVPTSSSRFEKLD
jgi:hypothetical protein